MRRPLTIAAADVLSDFPPPAKRPGLLRLTVLLARLKLARFLLWLAARLP